MNDVTCCGRLFGVDGERAQRGEFLSQRRVHHLVDALGAREVAQAYRTQVLQRDACRQPVRQQYGQRLRSQHLAAVRRRHDARRAVHHAAEEIVVAPLDHAGMSPQRTRRAMPAVAARIGERLLQPERGGDRVLRVVEGGAHAVARHLDDAAAMRLDRGTGQRVVARERRLHARRLALPQLSAALDVGEEEGRDRGVIVHAWNLEASGGGRLLYGTAIGAASSDTHSGVRVAAKRIGYIAHSQRGKIMNPLLNERIAQFDSPFRRLDELLAGIAPNPELTPIIMSVGEPQDAPPPLLAESVAAHAHLWNRYPPAVGTPEFRRAAQGYLHRRYAGTRGRIDPDAEISPVTSSREGLYLAASVATGPSRAAPLAVMQNPFYQTYRAAAIMAGRDAFVSCRTADSRSSHSISPPSTKTRGRARRFSICARRRTRTAA